MIKIPLEFVKGEIAERSRIIKIIEEMEDAKQYQLVDQINLIDKDQLIKEIKK